MPAKLLNSLAVETSPLPWKQRSAAARPADSKRAAPRSGSEEAPALRQKVDELTAASEQASRQAFEAGRAAGDAAARRALEAEVRASTEKLAQTIAGVAATRAEAFRRAEADTVKLAIEIARRVLHRELSMNPTAIEALVKAALEKLQSQEIYRVKVHPDQERVIRTCLEQAGRSQGIEIIGDPSQQKGGALFELSRGALDASVETQLREIERGLADELEVRR